VFIGGSATATINVTRNGYDGPLTLSASGLPAGVTATFDPSSLTGSTRSSTLSVVAAPDASPNGGQLNILITGTDSVSTFLAIPLSVGRPQVTVTRSGTGTGTITSSPPGINCGSTCTASFAFGTNVTLTATPGAASAFGAWAGNACTGTAPTCTLTVTAAPTVIATFNSTAQGFSFGFGSGAGAVPQGGSATATATITRVNGFAGAITLTPSGVPSGVTVTANPVSGTDNTATLNITAASSVAVSSYPIAIMATASGVPSRTATLNVQVTPASGGSGNVAFNFAACDPSEVPIWFAAQNGSGAWTRVTPGSNNTFTFDAGAGGGGFAWVIKQGAGFSTTVGYGSRSELTSMALGSFCGGLHQSTGTQRLTGTASGIGTNSATVSVGGASTDFQPLQGLSFTLNQVPAGSRDLLATAKNINSNGSVGVPRMILRRNVTYTATIPTLQFNGAEWFQPVFRGVFTNNLNGDQSSAAVSFVTLNGASAPYLSEPGGPNGFGYAGVPDSLLQPGDLHAISVFAAPSTGTSYRFVFVLHHSAVADTLAFGPSLNQPTVTTVGTTPYLRLRAQLPSQAEYAGLADATFSQNENIVDVAATAGYTGTTPPSWSLDIPDLTGAGYDPAWGLRSGSPVNWDVGAVAGNFLPFFGGASPFDGARIVGAGVTSTSSAVSPLRRSVKARR